MSQQAITAELKRWIVEQASAGFSTESVLQAMRAAGWQEDVALAALESTLTEHLAQQAPGLLSQVEAATRTATSASASASTAPGRRPMPHVPRGVRQIDLGDRQVDVLVSMSHPELVVFGGLLSDEECDALIDAARPRMARSLTVQTQTGGEELNADRTSQGMFFRRGESGLIAQVEDRIARLVNWPIENGEGLQVLHYRPGAEYKPHYDYFDPQQPGTAAITQRGGQRLATLVMYLNHPLEGGATTFPDVGLEVAPQRGNAVFFAYDRPHPATKTLHGGAPVLQGDKWVATKWLRERTFT